MNYDLNPMIFLSLIKYIILNFMYVPWSQFSVIQFYSGAGGGWDEGTATRRPTRGTALLEGAFGGESCTSSQIMGAGGFGGGGGGCTSGGGGGGYSGA